MAVGLPDMNFAGVVGLAAFTGFTIGENGDARLPKASMDGGSFESLVNESVDRVREE